MGSGSSDSLRSGLEDGVCSFYGTHVPKGRRVCVALSGGLDSTVLLHLSRDAARSGDGFELGALHIDHGLSPNSGEWADFCSELCRSLDIPLETVRAKLDRDASGVEARARTARRRAYARCGVEYVALAHHMDDQAETFLFRALRGAGAKSLAGMDAAAPLSGDSPATLLRPLLGYGRRELLAYAESRKLEWREDESNSDERISRNFIRRRVLPPLEERFPQSRAGLRATGREMRRCQSLLAQLAQLDHAAAVEGDGWARGHFRRAGEERTCNWIHHLALANGEDCSRRRIREIARQIRLPAGQAAGLQAGLGGRTLVAHGDSLFLVGAAADDAQSAPVKLSFDSGMRYRDSCGELTFERDDRRGIDGGILRSQGIELRRGAGRERLDGGPARPPQRVRELLREARLPPWERAAVPLVYVGGSLAAVPNIAVGAGHAANGQEGYFPRWRSRLTVPSDSALPDPL